MSSSSRAASQFRCASGRLKPKRCRRPCSKSACACSFVEAGSPEIQGISPVPYAPTRSTGIAHSPPSSSAARRPSPLTSDGFDFCAMLTSVSTGLNMTRPSAARATRSATRATSAFDRWRSVTPLLPGLGPPPSPLASLPLLGPASAGACASPPSPPAPAARDARFRRPVAACTETAPVAASSARITRRVIIETAATAARPLARGQCGTAAQGSARSAAAPEKCQRRRDLAPAARSLKKKN